MSDLIKTKSHWLIRVGDGENFRRSKYAFWGIKRGRGGCFKTFVKNHFTKGDILWFFTNKSYGGKIIGMAEYNCFYDREDEPILQIHTLKNEEQNWLGDEEWDIQIHYTKLYNTEKQNIPMVIQCGSNIMDYRTLQAGGQIPEEVDLDKHYEGFTFYSEVISRPEMA